MDKQLIFPFGGIERMAFVQFSLKREGCYVFTRLKDTELIRRFGETIEFEFDPATLAIAAGETSQGCTLVLQQALLEALKALPEFCRQLSVLRNSVQGTLPIDDPAAGGVPRTSN